LATTAPAEAGTITAPARPRRSVGQRWVALWLPALPLLVIIGALLLAPALLLIVQSFSGTSGLTLDLWARVLGSALNREAIVTSVVLGVTCATIATLIGAPMAWLISRMFPRSRAGWLALLNVAANFGGIGLAFAYIAVLGTQGMITLGLQGAGLGFVPPRPSSFIGLTAAYSYTNVPLFVLLTIPAMGILRAEWWEAAQTASATRWQFWRMIGIPVLTPFIAGGWLLIFTWSIGIYGIAYGLAGGGGAAAIALITLQIGNILGTDVFGAGRAAVLAVLLMAMATASLVIYRWLLRRALRWL
jgi:putative spermidine/putrescine transport system permease protein